MSLENIELPIKVLSYNRITGEVYVKTYDLDSLAQYIGVDAEDFSNGKN